MAIIMNKPTHLRTVLILLLGLGFATALHQAQAQAQSLACGPDDRQCLEESLGQACSESEETCLGWLRQVQTHALAENPEWRLIVAGGYVNLLSFGISPEDANRYRDLSRSLYRQMLEIWPDGNYAAQAYTGLAAVTDNLDESITLMRNAVNADPGDFMIAFLHARGLQHRGQIDDYREAADLYRTAYSLTKSNGYYYAATALQIYEGIGEVAEAEEFRGQVSQDSGMDAFANEAASAQFSEDLERAAEVMERACDPNIMVIFGTETCTTGVDMLVAATRSTNYLPTRRSIVDVASEGMRMLTAAGAGTSEERSQRESRFAAIYQEWIEADAATAATYILWAQHPESESDERVVAYERAVELAPDNGRYRYWLAQEYIAKGRYDEAIQHLNQARETLPENRTLTLESVDRAIRRAESERSLR